LDPTASKAGFTTGNAHTLNPCTWYDPQSLIRTPPEAWVYAAAYIVGGFLMILESNKE
jgi:hypothetical protein